MNHINNSAELSDTPVDLSEVADLVRSLSAPEQAEIIEMIKSLLSEQ